MNLAVTSPTKSAYSETFIRMQMERLPCSLRIYGGLVGCETVPGGLIAPLHTLRGLWDTAYLRGFKKMGGTGPHTAELKRRLRKNQIDIVLANYGPSGAALLPTCLELSIPLVVHFHGYDAHLHAVVTPNRVAYQELGQRCAKIVVVSERMRAALGELGIPQERMVLARCGVDPERFKPRERVPSTPTFFGVGRFVDKKAPYLTLLAFQKVHEQFPNSRLILAGDGVLLETTRNLAEAIGIASAVEFPGVIAPADVARFMQRATAFVQHSVTPMQGPSAGDSEGTPVAMLEAMMTGLPIIGTDHAGIGEVVQDGITGYLVKERDVEGMAKAMVRVAASESHTTELGQAARDHALKHHTADIYINQLMSALSSAL